MNWKEQFDNKLGEDFGADLEGKEKVKVFISTEIIEKLIEDAVSIKFHSEQNFKQQLRDKWL